MLLVVRVLNKYDGPDPHVAAKVTGRGDVIEVLDDNQEPGRLTRINPSWVILRAPISRAQAEALKSGDQDEFNPLSRLRAFGLNLDALIARGYPIPTHTQARKTRDEYEAEAEASGASRSDTKYSERFARAVAIIDISEADFIAARFSKPALTDPGIIG